MTLKELQERAHATALKSGFWDSGNGPEQLATKLALVHSEVSEALEEVRDPVAHLDDTVTYTETGKPLGFAVELADIVIRVADLAQRQGIDLETAIRIKMQYNETRPPKHGKRL
jgi:NTP pyrophosphatase (non-canonical NTP hydrolase)